MKRHARYISAVLAALMLFGWAVFAGDIELPEIPSTPQPHDPVRVKIGDIDGDKVQATPKDAMYLARYIAGWQGYELKNPDAADIDRDSVPATLKDAVILARYIAGWGEYAIYFDKD